MEISDGKQAEKGLKTPKRSKNEAKKRSSAVWDQENSQVRILSPRPKPPVSGHNNPDTGAIFNSSLLFPRLFLLLLQRSFRRAVFHILRACERRRCMLFSFRLPAWV